MTTPESLTELLRYTGGRLIERMAGLTDEEWAWTPTADPDISIRWRLDHLVDAFTEERLWSFLGVEVPPDLQAPGPAPDALWAIGTLQEVVEGYAALVSAQSEDDLAVAMGEVAGPYGEASRADFVLHMADELIHHGAEASLLRDLWAHRG